MTEENEDVWQQFVEPLEGAQYQDYASTLGAVSDEVQSFHSLATVGIRNATAVCAALKLASPIPYTNDWQTQAAVAKTSSSSKGIIQVIKRRGDMRYPGTHPELKSAAQLSTHLLM